METEIKSELKRIENSSNIKILYAVESGSRAWGFASKDSDWDVRYIYIHPPEWYLRIDLLKDSQVRMLENNLDLAGWELRKTLRLFRKSNPPLFEWLRSPFVYYEDDIVIPKLRKLGEYYFNPRSCMHHYLHIAESTFTEHLQAEKVNLKKYFYALRTVLACEWIESKGTMPPMEFSKLVESVVKEQSLLSEISKLLLRKKRGDELKMEPKSDVLNKHLKDRLAFFSERVKTLEAIEQPVTSTLDEIFRSALTEVWHK